MMFEEIGKVDRPLPVVDYELKVLNEQRREDAVRIAEALKEIRTRAATEDA